MSTEAVSCPHCGAPRPAAATAPAAVTDAPARAPAAAPVAERPRRSGLGTVVAVVLALVAVAVVLWYFGLLDLR